MEVADDGTPMANVLLSLMHELGLDDKQEFGDATGEFSFTHPGIAAVEAG